MNRYQILIEYMGTNFRGWQIQKKGATIQGLIQEKLTKLLKQKIILIKNCFFVVLFFITIFSLVKLNL